MNKQYEYELQLAQKKYSEFKPIKSQALQGKEIVFNSEGFNHLIFKRDRKERDRTHQITRFRLLESAYQVLRRTSTHQEYEERLEEIIVKMKKQKTKVSKTARYWGFIAITRRNDRIKIVVRQIGDGKLHFWSVYPWWQKTRHGEFQMRTMSTGELTSD